MNTLEEITGKHTELVSFYVKSSWSTAQATSYIDGELAKSLNIKSKLTRDNVQRALYKIKNNIQTGVVFFSGVVNDELFFKVIQPPKSVNFTLYRCSNRFHTDELSRFEPKKSYGLLVLDNSSAGFGLISENSFDFLTEIDSGVPGKHHKGGSSAVRFERLREASLNEYYHRIAEYTKNLLPFEIFIGGPAFTKDKVINGKYLDYRTRVFAVLDTSYSGREGVRELMEKVSRNRILKSFPLVSQKNALQNALKLVPDGVFYTKSDILANLSSISTLIHAPEVEIDFDFKGERVCIDSQIEELDQLRAIGGILGVKYISG